MAYFNNLSTAFQASDKRRRGSRRVEDSGVEERSVAGATFQDVVSDSDDSDSVIAEGDIVYAHSPKLETLQGEPLTVVSVNKSLDAAVVKDKTGKCMAVRLSYLKRE